MKDFKKLSLLVAGMAALATPMAAQDKVEATVEADLVSNYIWRGQHLGDVSVQPTLGVAYKGFSLSAWGNYGISNPGDKKELDLTLAYTTGGFNVGITDYWSGSDGDRYFLYSNGSTKHVFEANVGYDFGPVALQWYTNFAGADGKNKSDKRAYSSYFEVSAPFKLATCDWTATVGAVPYATTSYEDANGFAVTNVSLRAEKAIKVTDSWSLPLFASVNANPSTQKAYLVFGFTLRP